MSLQESNDKPRDECGVFGIYAPGDKVGFKTYLGLIALQHRGEESAGIAVSDGTEIYVHKKMGLVTEVFSEKLLNNLRGNIAIGHVRYSTSGDSTEANAQPLFYSDFKGSMALAHNGSLTNASQLKKRLEPTYLAKELNTDSEIFLRFIAKHRLLPLNKILELCMKEISGAFSLVMMTENKLIGLRDPYGMRPLCLGKLKGTESSYVLASETCAVEAVGGTFIREIEPGEIVIIDQNGIQSLQTQAIPSNRRLCIFEYIYLSRSDSIIDGQTVSLVRREFGRELAREYPVKGDVVISVPDSGTPVAMGYAEELKLPFRQGLLRNQSMGRTFIKPGQKNRELAVRLKFNPIGEVLQGQRVVIVDDSLVRGTTSSHIIRMLREAGAKEVHFIVASPPLRYPCYYGVDISSPGELIAARRSIEEIRLRIGADILHYLSLEGMFRRLERPRDFCKACFDGSYPVQIFGNDSKVSII